jgi:predicted ATPase/DNA-binding CsgD family transcriptional regulator
VRERLLRPDTRLLTLTGTGGTGKTRLALAVAADVLDAFDDGVCFVDLAPLHDHTRVVPTIAQTLGVKERAGEPLPVALGEYLRDKRLLLVLDNFEQVVAAGPDVAALLEGSAGSKVLVTSRTPLHVYGEHQYQVPSLALPDPSRVPSPEAAAGSEAVALFLQRAEAAQAGFRPSRSDLAAIAEICARLDGLPLAIELAAARVRLMPPPALLARLERRLPLLTGGARNAPARHQTLRGTIDWSHELLSGPEQALFRRLAAFAGGCTLAAAEAVCRQPEAPAGEASGVVDAIASLVDKSLLEQRGTVHGEPRFAMLETIREYAIERLEGSGEAEAVRSVHARAFLEMVERAEPELTGPRQAVWLARFDADEENLRAALACALDRAAAELALRLSGALWRFWVVRGRLGEGLSWLERALAAGGDAPLAARAKAANAAGNLARLRGIAATATAWHEQSLALRRELGDALGVAASLINLGNVALDLGEYERAVPFYQQSLELYRGAAHRWGIALALNNLGAALRGDGRSEEARALLEESLALRRELGDQYGVAETLENLARLALDRGDLRGAEALSRESLSLWRELGDRLSAPRLLEDLAAAAAAGGELERAARLWGAAERLRTELGVPRPVYHLRRQEPAMARDRLGEVVFAAAWAAGAAMADEEAIAYALSDDRPADPLSTREREVAALIARGFTSREIAAELIVSEKTVDAHADHIRRKLGLRSRAEIAAWVALRTGGPAV